MIAATMPSEFHARFEPNQPFPPEIIREAATELENFASILKREGVNVHRPKIVDWKKSGGYTGAMPRDGLLTVGNHIIEACFAWQCRHQEIDLAFADILREIGADSDVKVIRAPKPPSPDTIYEDHIHGHADGYTNGHSNSHKNGVGDRGPQWAVNNLRPAFDAADFMRFGKVLIGQLSTVTNRKGVEYLQQAVPQGYSVEILAVEDPHAMHIDATILPLRAGLLIYNPDRTSEEALRKHDVLRDWELRAYPFPVHHRADAPLFMTSAWLVLNVLSIDERRVVVEAYDTEFAEWLRTLGMEPILCPFRHVNSIGGSFHCATVDLVRNDGLANRLQN